MIRKMLFVFVLLFGMACAAHADGSPSGSAGGVSNIENQTKIFENTTLGKERAAWSKGRVIEKGQSVECQIDNLMRGGIKNC